MKEELQSIDEYLTQKLLCADKLQDVYIEDHGWFPFLFKEIYQTVMRRRRDFKPRYIQGKLSLESDTYLVQIPNAISVRRNHSIDIFNKKDFSKNTYRKYTLECKDNKIYTSISDVYPNGEIHIFP